MAFAEYGLWVAVVRLPSDDFKLKQVIQLNGVKDYEHALHDLKFRHTNPDVIVEELYPVESHEQVYDKTAAVLKENGHAHRSPREGEVHLTKPLVAKLKGRKQHLGGPPDLSIPPVERAARAASEVRVAAAGEV